MSARSSASRPIIGRIFKPEIIGSIYGPMLVIVRIEPSAIRIANPFGTSVLDCTMYSVHVAYIGDLNMRALRTPIADFADIEHSKVFRADCIRTINAYQFLFLFID